MLDGGSTLEVFDVQLTFKVAIGAKVEAVNEWLQVGSALDHFGWGRGDRCETL